MTKENLQKITANAGAEMQNIPYVRNESSKPAQNSAFTGLPWWAIDAAKKRYEDALAGRAAREGDPESGERTA